MWVQSLNQEASLEEEMAMPFPEPGFSSCLSTESGADRQVAESCGLQAGQEGGLQPRPLCYSRGSCHVCGEALVPQVGFITFHHVLGNKIYASVCMHAKSLQLCPTLCSPMDCSPAGFSVPVSSLVTFKHQGWVGGKRVNKGWMFRPIRGWQIGSHHCT